MKAHVLTIIGLILATLAAVFFWVYLLTAGLTSATGEPVIFVGLLMLVAVCIIASWAKPAVGPLLFLFVGVMLATYSAVTSGRSQLIQSLSLGAPFIVAALLSYAGNQFQTKKNPDKNKA